MDRRKFIGIAAGGLLAPAVSTCTQPAAGMRRIGVLTAGVVSRTVWN